MTDWLVFINIHLHIGRMIKGILFSACALIICTITGCTQSTKAVSHPIKLKEGKCENYGFAKQRMYFVMEDEDTTNISCTISYLSNGNILIEMEELLGHICAPSDTAYVDQKMVKSNFLKTTYSEPASVRIGGWHIAKAGTNTKIEQHQFSAIDKRSIKP